MTNFDIISQIIYYDVESSSNTYYDIEGEESINLDRNQSIILNPVYMIMDFLKNLSKKGLIITGIDYSIKLMPNMIAPEIKNVSFSLNLNDKLSTSILMASTTQINSRNIESIIKETNEEYVDYFKELSKANNPDIREEFLDDLKQEMIINNKTKIKEQENITLKEKWRKQGEGVIRFKLDKELICKNPNHKIHLSELSIEKPYNLTEIICSECNNKMKIHPAEIVMPENELLDIIKFEAEETLKFGIIHAIDLGTKMMKMINLTIDKEYINQIMILPKTMYYQTKEGNYKITFKELTPLQFKRTIGRDKYNLIKITNYEKVS